MTSEAVKKKLVIFPFDIDIDGALGPLKGKVFTLNHTGLIIEVFHAGFKAQAQVKMKFNLPISDFLFEVGGKVVKTYNQHKGSKIQYYIEVHFGSLKIPQLDALDVFIHKNNALVQGKKEKAKTKIESKAKAEE